MNPVQWAVMNDVVGVSVMIIDEKGFFGLGRNEVDRRCGGLWSVSPKQQSIG